MCATSGEQRGAVKPVKPTVDREIDMFVSHALVSRAMCVMRGLQGHRSHFFFSGRIGTHSHAPSNQAIDSGRKDRLCAAWVRLREGERAPTLRPIDLDGARAIVLTVGAEIVLRAGVCVGP